MRIVEGSQTSRLAREESTSDITLGTHLRWNKDLPVTVRLLKRRQAAALQSEERDASFEIWRDGNWVLRNAGGSRCCGTRSHAHADADA
jgi:hypothetical protein